MAVQAATAVLLPANVTMTETDVEYLVDVDVSGFAPAALDVEIEDDELTIHGESMTDALDESIRLPFDADVEWLRALYDKGRLEVHVPRLGSRGLGRRPIEIVVRRPVP